MNNRKNSTNTEDDVWDMKSISSEDNDQVDSKDIEYDVAKYIRAPNPFIEKGLYVNNEVKTAYKLNFVKLPNFVAGNDSNIHNDKLRKIEKISQEDLIIHNTNRISLLDNEQIQISKNGKTLFHLYPENDPRQVYKKYKKEKHFDIEDRVYASLFIDLNKMIKTGKTSKIQYVDDAAIINEDPKITDPDTLIFSSSFESGNLFAAFKISNEEYDLILQNDINSKGHTQWFFFSISNTIKDTIIKFNIVNMMKSDSLFNYGMKPVALSTIDNKKNGIGWQKDGFNISYLKNYIHREYNNYKTSNISTYYTLTFSYKIKYDKDTIYFAQCYPYTYSDLNNYLNKLCLDSSIKSLINRRVLCKTLAQNDCEYLTITSNKNIENMEQRYGIFFSARQHPGESLASYIMQGIIDYMIDQSEESLFLRQTCIFKIIPMLNPDGVIHGNYRTSLSGLDLNRRWKKPNKTLYPTIHHAKTLIRKFKKERSLQLILDLHGHSRKTNTFVYGCTDQANPMSSRIFPYLLSKISPSFSFKECRFIVQKSKESTARIALWKDLRLPNVFTLESSFSGYEKEGKFYHYTKQDYLNIGKDICKTLYIYLSQVVMGITSIPHELNSQGIQGNSISDNKKDILINGNNPLTWLEELQINKELIEWGEKSDDSGSDANPSEDDLPPEEISKLCSINNTKKHESDNKLKSSSNSNYNKKIDKATASTNTNLEEFKKFRPKTTEKKSSTLNLSKKVMLSQPEEEINTTIVVYMVDKETQTEEIYFDLQNCDTNDVHFLTDFQNSNYIPIDRKDLSYRHARIDKLGKKYLDTSFGATTKLPLSHQPLLNPPPQLQYYRIYNAEKQSQNLRNVVNGRYPPGLRELRKASINELASRIASTIHTKKKVKKNLNDPNLLIKGRKYDELREFRLIETDLETINIQQNLSKYEAKNTSISELSTIIFKNMTTPRISHFIKNSQAKQQDERPITSHEKKLLEEINTNLLKDKDSFYGGANPILSDSPKSQYAQKSRIIGTSSGDKRPKMIRLRSITKGLKNSVHIKNHSLSPSKGILDSGNKEKDLPSMLILSKQTDPEFLSKLSLSANGRINDTTEGKDSKYQSILPGLASRVSTKNEADLIHNQFNLHDLNKKQKDKIFSPPKEDINRGFNSIKNKFELKVKESGITNSIVKNNPTKYRKDDLQNKLWMCNVYNKS